MTALPRCYSSPLNLYNRYSTFLFAHKGFKLCSGFEFHKKSGFKIEMLLFHNRSQNLSRNTGGPSSSCEMIILRNKGRGEIKRVCMGTDLLPLIGIKKIWSNSLFSHTNSYNYTMTHISQDGLLTAGAWAAFGERKTKWRETLDYLSSFSLLLECSSHFLSALQQNRAKSRLIYLLYNKEAIKFPTHYFQFSKQTLFSNILS